MTTDDIHDLFDNGETDESDGSAEEPADGTDESGDSGEWDELPLREDEEPVGPADSALEETTVPTTTSPDEDADGESEMAWSPSSSEGTPLDDSEESESAVSTTMSFEGATDDDRSESRLSSTTVSEGAPPEDTDESGSTTTSEEANRDDSDEFEASVSTTSLEGDTEVSELATSTAGPPEGAVEDDADESPSTESTDPEEAASDDPGEFESTEAPTMAPEGSVEADPGEFESADEPTPREDAPAEDRDESETMESETAVDEGVTASVDETTADDQGTSESGGAIPSTAGPIVDDHDESETARRGAPGPLASETAVGERVATPTPGSDRLSTGIDVLDRAMGGGVPPGRLVLLVADPGVQSELIVDSVLAQRDTLYVTTDRPDWEVMKDIEPGLGTGEVKIREHTPDSLLSGVDLLLDELGTSSNLVLDSVNELELVPRQRYRIFLSDVKQRLFETGSMGLLTGVTVGHESARDLTLRRADIVWQLETRTTDREIENRLSVPKFRGGAAMTETVKLELTDEVRVDTSWKDG